MSHCDPHRRNALSKGGRGDYIDYQKGALWLYL
nr:MAG TPA: hypothetical protein [Caudoviricetes sp.]